MNVDIQAFLNDITSTLQTVDKVLEDWDGKGCYQLPILMMKIKSEMNWDDKKMRSRDPIIREYLRDHSKFSIRNGAGGGVLLRSALQAKQAEKLAKEQAKADILNTIDTMLAQKISAASQIVDSQITDTLIDTTTDDNEDSDLSIID